MEQQTAVELLLSKIPDAAEIKAFISDNNADEKMLDEWLWERIHKNVDYKQMEKEQRIKDYNVGYLDAKCNHVQDAENYLVEQEYLASKSAK